MAYLLEVSREQLIAIKNALEVAKKNVPERGFYEDDEDCPHVMFDICEMVLDHPENGMIESFIA